jgi:hypothetical protein
MWEKRNVYRLLVGKPEGKRPLGRPRRRWVYAVTCLAEGRRYYATFLSLLGNRNTSKYTLTTPVLLRCMATNNMKDSVFHWASMML